MTRSMPMPSMVTYFQADHPFYYSIVNGRSRSPVFTGVIATAPAPQWQTPELYWCIMSNDKYMSACKSSQFTWIWYWYLVTISVRGLPRCWRLRVNLDSFSIILDFIWFTSPAVRIMLLSAANFGESFEVDHGFQFYLMKKQQVVFIGSVANL